MTDQEKIQLIKLLNQYQYELLDSKNIITYGSSTYGFSKRYKCGTKAQYNHARCIANKLSTELGKDIRSW